MRQFGNCLAIFALFSFLWGCGSSSEGQSSGSQFPIETLAEPEIIAAGTPLVVRCEFEGNEEMTAESNFQLLIEETEGYESEGLTLTFTKIGEYHVACADEELTSVDETPAKVTVVAGLPVSSIATVEPSTTAPGANANVTCSVTDDYGNEITEDIEVVVEPSDSVDIDGFTLSSEISGSYTVSCAYRDTEFDNQESAEWTVEPGAPATFELAFEPDQPAYKIGDEVTITGVAVDEFGNKTTGLKLESLAVTPEDDIFIKGDDLNIVKVQKEGFFDVSALSADFEGLEATATLVVDQTAPVVTIRSPERGITTDTMTEVTIEGHVEDNLGEIGLLEVVGQEVNPDEDGNFEITVPLIYGANHLIVLAEDPYGNQTEAGRTILSSAYFYPMEEASPETDAVSSGLVILLSKNAIDDGDHDPENVDDLATIFELVFSSIDLGSMIPNPIFTAPLSKCDYLLKEVTFEQPKITLAPQIGSLGLEVLISDFKANLYNEGGWACTLNWEEFWHTGPVPITISELRLNTNVEVNLSAEGTSSSAEETEVIMDGLDFGAVDPLDWLSGALSGVMELVFAGIIEEEVGSALGDVFSSFALNEEFEIPAFVEGMEPNKLSLQTVPSAIQFDPEFMRIALDALASASAPSRPHTVLGSIGYSGCGPDSQPLTPPESPLVIGLHDDVLNELLFGVWEGGTLSADLGPEDTKDLDLGGGSLPVSDLSLRLNPLLPLVFNSCGDAGNRIQIGDLYMEASFSMSVLGKADIAFWIQGEAGVEFAMVEDETGKKLGFDIQDLDPLILEVAKNEGLFEGDDAALRSLIKDQLLPELLGSLTGGLGSFPLPDIDLGGAGAGIPEGTSISLGVDEFDRKGGYLEMKGALK